MKSDNYINIQGWMVNSLGLSGNELVIYAILYGFSQDGVSGFSGSLNYISECTNVTVRTVRNIISKFVADNLVSEEEIDVQGNKSIMYKCLSCDEEKISLRWKKFPSEGKNFPEMEKISPTNVKQMPTGVNVQIVRMSGEEGNMMIVNGVSDSGDDIQLNLVFDSSKCHLEIEKKKEDNEKEKNQKKEIQKKEKKEKENIYYVYTKETEKQEDFAVLDANQESGEVETMQYMQPNAKANQKEEFYPADCDGSHHAKEEVEEGGSWESRKTALLRALSAAASNYPSTGENVEETATRNSDWKSDINLYIAIVEEAQEKLIADETHRALFLKYNPRCDYDLTVEKAVDMFWGTEDGWEFCKKKRKGKKLDMYSTLKKNLERNRVYADSRKDKEDERQKYVEKRIAELDKKIKVWE